MTKHTDSFPCMGNTANIVVIGDQQLLRKARLRLVGLENKWSRFIDTSEISLINNSDGKEVYVSADTVTLVRYLVDAQARTHGLFDPSLLPALIGLGYGVSRVEEPTQLEAAFQYAFTEGRQVLVEEGVTGKEVGCGVLRSSFNFDSKKTSA